MQFVSILDEPIPSIDAALIQRIQRHGWASLDLSQDVHFFEELHTWEALFTVRICRQVLM